MFDLSNFFFRACFVLAISAWAMQGGPSFAQSLIVLDVGLIDGTGSALKPGMSVLVRDGRIAEIANSVTAPNDAAVVDGRGKFLIPGLIDVHVHLIGGGAWQNYSETKGDVLDFAQGERALHGFLWYGVTSIYDPGNNPEYIYEMRRRERDGEIISPRIFATGKLLSYPGSWGVGYAGLGVPDWPDTKAVLDAKLERDPDMQKFTYERLGFGPMPLVPQLPERLLKKMVSYVKKRDVRTTAHISDERSAREAIAAGIDSLAHPVVVARQSDDFVKLLIDRDIEVATTLTVFDDIVRVGEDPSFLDTPRYESILTESEINARKTKASAYYRRLDWPRWYKALLPFMKENIRQIHDAGGIVALGSDRSDGAATMRELELIVEAGITPFDAIKVATLNAARYLGKEDELGSIEVGKRADMVLLAADPTIDVKNFAAVDAVIKDGRVLRREDLDPN